MHVVMGIDVIERKTRLAEGFKLGTDLGLQLFPYPRPEEEVHSGIDEIG